MKINIYKQGSFISTYSEEDEKVLEKLSDGIYAVDLKNLDTRTLQQNKALHKWCSMIADTLNKHNLYMTGVFGNEIDWTMSLVKTQIVKTTIKKVFDINSTTKLKRKEIDHLIDFITIAFGRKGVSIPAFPKRELWEERRDNV